MRWKTPKRHITGDERIRLIFAFWPTECEDGTTRWLEWLAVTERYRGSWNDDGGWLTVRKLGVK